MTNSMVMGSISSPTEADLRDSLDRESSMARELSETRPKKMTILLSILVIGWVLFLMVEGQLCTKMETSTRELSREGREVVVGCIGSTDISGMRGSGEITVSMVLVNCIETMIFFLRAGFRMV